MTTIQEREAPLIAEIVEELRLLEVREQAQIDPKYLINEIKFFDPSQADKEDPQWVEFKMFPPDDWEPPIIWLPNGEWEFVKTGATDWYWQSLMIDWLHDPTLKKYLVLKARQLGITLLACAYALWLMLYRPGSFSVAYSYEETEAKKLVQASWAMFQSLPEILRNGVTVISPTRSEEPAEWIKLRHPDGRISSFQALPATKKHGHGARVTFAIMDEVARQDYARQIYTAINPATTRGNAKLLMVSTADGVSNLESGVGNYFHWLYYTRREKKLAYRFLPWNLEPTRDEKWYAEEAMKLDDVERNQQYPLNEHDAFMLSGANYFDSESLEFYRNYGVRHPQLTGHFVVSGARTAKFMAFPSGTIDIYEEPRANDEYAIFVDCATGYGTDFTSGHVISLASGAIVAEFHGKMEAPRAAVQFHFLGKWYNTALIAVERQGGYGDAMIIALKDGTNALTPYPRVYRHTQYTRSDRQQAHDYGFPMGAKLREQVLTNLKDWIRQRQLPWVSLGDMDELQTFVYADTKPSPRAQLGCNDDRVMSLAGCIEMFRQYGHFPGKPRIVKRARYRPLPTRSR